MYTFRDYPPFILALVITLRMKKSLIVHLAPSSVHQSLNACKHLNYSTVDLCQKIM